MVDLQIAAERTIEDAFQKCMPEHKFSAFESIADIITVMDLCGQIGRRIAHKTSLQSQISEVVAWMDSRCISTEWSRQVLHLPYQYTQAQVELAYQQEKDKNTKAGTSCAKVRTAYGIMQESLGLKKT